MVRRFCRLKVAAAVAMFGWGLLFTAGTTQAGWFRDRGANRCRYVYGSLAGTTNAAPANSGITAPVPPAGGSQGFLPPAPPIPPTVEIAPAPARFPAALIEDRRRGRGGWPAFPPFVTALSSRSRFCDTAGRFAG